MRVAITETLIADLKHQSHTRVIDVWDITVRGLVLRLLRLCASRVEPLVSRGGGLQSLGLV